MQNDLIPEKMPGRRIVVPAELDVAERLKGIRTHYLGVPIYRMHHYSSPPGVQDEYKSVRLWYRKNVLDTGGLCIIHRDDAKVGLAGAPEDALPYLTVENDAERARHTQWKEPGNEAVEISQWLFPAHAVDQALIAQDFDYDIVIVRVMKDEKELDRVYYFVDAHEHRMTYSHHFRGPRPGKI